MIQTDQKYSYGPRSTLYRPGSTLYWPGSTLYSPWSFPDVPRSTQYCPGSTLYSPWSFPDVPNIVPEGFFWLDGGGLGSFTSLTNLMRGVYKRRALAPCDFLECRQIIRSIDDLHQVWQKNVLSFHIICFDTVLCRLMCSPIEQILKIDCCLIFTWINTKWNVTNLLKFLIENQKLFD